MLTKLGRDNGLAAGVVRSGAIRPVLVVVLSAVIELEPVLRSAREQGDMLRYIYIGRSWQKPDRLAVFTERMKYAALATFGLTRYVPSQDLLLGSSRHRGAKPPLRSIGEMSGTATTSQLPRPRSRLRPDRTEPGLHTQNGRLSFTVVAGV